MPCEVDGPQLGLTACSIIVLAALAVIHQHAAIGGPSRALHQEALGQETLARAIGPHDPDVEGAAFELREGDQVAARRPHRRCIPPGAKADALREFAHSCEVAMENTVAIGDGANDLDMMAAAGISIAFNAKPIVAEQAQFVINEPSLNGVARLIKL